MRIRNWTSLLFFLFSGLMFGQAGLHFSQPSVSPWRFGGGLGFNFGSDDYFSVYAAPFVGYEIGPKIETGVSAGYQYSNWKASRQNVFNIGPYLNYYPVAGLFTRAQYEYYTGSNTVKHSHLKSSFDENALWVGAGYRSPGRVSFYAGLMYNLLYKSESSIFSNGFRPIVGISVGI